MKPVIRLCTTGHELIIKLTLMTDEQKAAFQTAVQLLGLPVGTQVTVSYTPVVVNPPPVSEVFTVN